MLSDTLVNGLEAYRIGPKVRLLRRRKSMGLVQLAAHSGLSPGMLSKIERGQLFPTLPTLLRIALVFGVGLDHFFVATEKRATRAVVRRKDRIRLPDRPQAQQPSYLFECLDYPVTDRRMETYFAEFPPGGERSRPHQHGGAELIYVVKGRIVVNAEDEEIELAEGDSMYFDSSVAHSYVQKGRTAAAAIVVVAPTPTTGNAPAWAAAE
jgi:transcriptional regulator with XRE-family HTH domain